MIEEKGNKVLELLGEHENKMIEYIVPAEGGDRVFAFTIKEIVIMEYGGYDPFDYDWVIDIFKNMKQDGNLGGFNKMEIDINMAITTGKWRREE